MPKQSHIIVSLTEEKLPAVIDLIIAQERRFNTLDQRLRAPRSREQIQAMLDQQQDAALPLLVLDEDAQVRAYLEPSCWNLAADDELLAFFTRRNGTVRHLTLPAPTEPDAYTVAKTVIDIVTEYWQQQQTNSEILRWPYCDRWLEPLLQERGFLLDSELAFTPAQHVQSYLTMPQLPHGYKIRLTQPEDEQRLLDLFEEELRFHEPYTPFVHTSPAVIQAFRQRLIQQWEDQSIDAGASQIIVVEHDRNVVALAEIKLYQMEEDEEPDFLPVGRYGLINNMSVCQQARGQGIGSMLTAAIMHIFRTMSLNGYILWYNPANPLSSQFWARRGFQPVWRTYQRLSTKVNNAITPFL
jgi:GNAT superfamily N-acetyltransferase